MTGADVVVVGGGIVGAACAYELTRAGLSVVLCEKDDLALGASGRNPGFVWMHTRRPGPQLALARFTRARLAELPEELEWDFDLRTKGGLIFVHDHEQLAVLKEFVEARRADGVDVTLLDGDRARELAPVLPERVVGASFCAEDAQITTARLVQGLAAGAERGGARVLRGTEVLEVHLAGGRAAGVKTTAGTIDAGAVVLAAGVWTPLLAERLGVRLPITPMRLQVVATGPMPPMLDRLLYGPRAVRQYDLFHALPSYREELFVQDEAELASDLPFLELACQTPQGRFLLGCPMDFPGHVWQPDLEGVGTICRALPEAIPALRGARFEAAWAGLLPHTPDSLPVIDELPDHPGVLVAAGHVFGNSAGLATASMISAMLRGERSPVDPAPFRIDREGLAGGGGTRW